MRSKYALFAGASLIFASMSVAAQTTPTTTQTRDPVKGDPGAKPAARPNQSTRAATIARSDKQAPGTENGNQTDRALAGGGAH